MHHRPYRRICNILIHLNKALIEWYLEKKAPKIFEARDHFYILLDEELVKPLFLYGIINLGVHQEFRRDEQSTNRIVSHNEHYVITSFFNNTTEFIETRDRSEERRVGKGCRG